MNICLPDHEGYFRFRDRLRSLEPSIYQDFECFPFFGAYQALFDMTTSLAQTYSHKLSFGVIGGRGPDFEALSVYFSRQGYSFQNYDETTGQTYSDWVDGLKKDTLFVVAHLDDALTGRLFELEE